MAEREILRSCVFYHSLSKIAFCDYRIRSLGEEKKENCRPTSCPRRTGVCSILRVNLGARTPGGTRGDRFLACRGGRPVLPVSWETLCDLLWTKKQSPKSLPQGGARDRGPRPPALRQSPRGRPATRPQRRGRHHPVTPVSPCGKWPSHHLSPAPLQTPSSCSAWPWTRGGSRGPSSEEPSVCHQIRAVQDGRRPAGGDPEDLQGDR